MCIRDRLTSDNFTFHKLDLADREGMASLFATEKFDRVIHLAAQAGVRYSLENPNNVNIPYCLLYTS
ncbi:NAD-dependent epimerase/dehydratase family protein, partial [Klebsiella pneumoniae]